MSFSNELIVQDAEIRRAKGFRGISQVYCMAQMQRFGTPFCRVCAFKSARSRIGRRLIQLSHRRSHTM